jgi:hypothetical protein
MTVVPQQIALQKAKKIIPAAVMGETYLVSFPSFRLLAIGAEVEAARAAAVGQTTTFVVVGTSEG